MAEAVKAVAMVLARVKVKAESRGVAEKAAAVMAVEMAAKLMAMMR